MPETAGRGADGAAERAAASDRADGAAGGAVSDSAGLGAQQELPVSGGALSPAPRVGVPQELPVSGAALSLAARAGAQQLFAFGAPLPLASGGS